MTITRETTALPMAGPSTISVPCTNAGAIAIAGTVALGTEGGMETATLTGSYQDPADARNWVFTFSTPLAVSDDNALVSCASVPLA